MTEVIVIGAGVSALSACKQLLEAGIKDIIVLEVIKLVTDSQVLIKTQKVVNLLFV